MPRFRMLSIVAPLSAALACRDVTSPPLTVVRDAQMSLRTPSALVTPSTTPQISTGYWHVCALNTSGMVTCWGQNPMGQATVPSGLVAVSQISATGHHTCALKADGTVACWGDNEVGQTAVPDGLASVSQISSGYMHSCALESDGTVVCWGAKDGIPWNYGQANVPAGLASVVQISAGLMQTCALKTDRTLVCWGNGYTVPENLGAVTQVSVGVFGSCALKADQSVICWGDNSYGEATVPDGLGSVAQVSAGFFHSCALKTDGTVACWGYNGYGETTVPTGLTSVAQVSAGAFYTCARKTDGTVACWGQLAAPADLNLGVQDATPPVVIHAISGTPSASGWYASDVTVTFTATDAESAVTTSGCVPQTVSATTSVGGVTFTCVATSAGGTTTDAVTIKLDKTLPAVSGAVTSGILGANGWYTGNVGITWTPSVAGPSGQTVSSDCATVTLASDTPDYLFTCSITTGAGITSAPGTVTVKRDATQPVVTYAGNMATYTVDQPVAITCTPSDNLSGIAASTCAAISGTGYGFLVGANTVSASATDHAGNVGSATTVFTVTVTPGSLCSLVQQWVSNGGVANSLCVKLDYGSYGAFRNELAAQSGKKISDANAAILLRLVNVLDP